MYNSGEKMTTAKAIELTGRSRKFIVKTMKKLQELGMVDWYGANKNDRNQYYTLTKN
jgi:ATP-dependent DNA helicase RecG